MGEVGSYGGALERLGCVSLCWVAVLESGSDGSCFDPTIVLCEQYIQLISILKNEAPGNVSWDLVVGAVKLVVPGKLKMVPVPNQQQLYEIPRRFSFHCSGGSALKCKPVNPTST